MGLLNQLAKEQSDKSTGSKKGVFTEIKRSYSDNKKLVRILSNNCCSTTASCRQWY